MKVSVLHSAQIAALSQCGMPLAKLVEKFPHYSRTTIFRHSKQTVGEVPKIDGRSKNKGRPKRLSTRDNRNLMRAIPRSRELEGSFTSKRIAAFAGIDPAVSNRTVRRYLNKSGYGYYRSRKKEGKSGILQALQKTKVSFVLEGAHLLLPWWYWLCV